MPDPIPTPIPTPQPTTIPAANTQEARLPSGELRDLQAPPSTTPTDGQTTSSDSTTTEAEKPPVQAPEAYADFKLPEGVKIDKTRLDSALPLFKEANLSQDQAQKLVDWYTKNQTTDIDAAKKTYLDMRAGWTKELADDPVIGSKLESVKTDIGRMLAHLGDAGDNSFRQAMDFTGAGDNPAVVRGLYKLAALVNEGKALGDANRGPSPHGQSPNGRATRPSPASAFYPNLPTSSS